MHMGRGFGSGGGGGERGSKMSCLSNLFSQWPLQTVGVMYVAIVHSIWEYAAHAHDMNTLRRG